MKLILELSGEHPDIPKAEIASVAEVIESYTQVAIVDIAVPDQIYRLAYTHRAMYFLGSSIADYDAFEALLDSLNINTDKPFCGRVKKMVDSGLDVPTVELEKLIGTKINGPVSLSNPEKIYRAIVTDGMIFFGEQFFELDRKPYHDRKPGNRPFFHPGVMMPRMARSLINLSCAQEGDSILDLFCGTGGIMIEADMIGGLAIGTDADPEMICGARQNLINSAFFVADACALPFPDNSIDHVVSDFPYGQSVLIIGDGLDSLYHGALAEIRRVTKPGMCSVIVTHRDIRQIVSQYFDILFFFEQRVHKSLTRRITVITH